MFLFRCCMRVGGCGGQRNEESEAQVASEPLYESIQHSTKQMQGRLLPEPADPALGKPFADYSGCSHSITSSRPFLVGSMQSIDYEEVLCITMPTEPADGAGQFADVENTSKLPVSVDASKNNAKQMNSSGSPPPSNKCRAAEITSGDHDDRNHLSDNSNDGEHDDAEVKYIADIKRFQASSHVHDDDCNCPLCQIAPDENGASVEQMYKLSSHGSDNKCKCATCMEFLMRCTEPSSNWSVQLEALSQRLYDVPSSISQKTNHIEWMWSPSSSAFSAVPRRAAPLPTSVGSDVVDIDNRPDSECESVTMGEDDCMDHTVSISDTGQHAVTDEAGDDNGHLCSAADELCYVFHKFISRDLDELVASTDLYHLDDNANRPCSVVENECESTKFLSSDSLTIHTQSDHTDDISQHFRASENSSFSSSLVTVTDSGGSAFSSQDFQIISASVLPPLHSSLVPFDYCILDSSSVDENAYLSAVTADATGLAESANDAEIEHELTPCYDLNVSACVSDAPLESTTAETEPAMLIHDEQFFAAEVDSPNVTSEATKGTDSTASLASEEVSLTDITENSMSDFVSQYIRQIIDSAVLRYDCDIDSASHTESFLPEVTSSDYVLSSLLDVTCQLPEADGASLPIDNEVGTASALEQYDDDIECQSSGISEAVSSAISLSEGSLSADVHLFTTNFQTLPVKADTSVVAKDSEELDVCYTQPATDNFNLDRTAESSDNIQVYPPSAALFSEVITDADHEVLISDESSDVSELLDAVNLTLAFRSDELLSPSSGSYGSDSSERALSPSMLVQDFFMQYVLPVETAAATSEKACQVLVCTPVDEPVAEINTVSHEIESEVIHRGDEFFIKRPVSLDTGLQIVIDAETTAGADLNDSFVSEISLTALPVNIDVVISTPATTKPSCLLRTLSEPHQKKTVRFADTHGLQLASVQHFEQPSPEDPPSSFEDFLTMLSTAATKRRAAWADHHPSVMSSWLCDSSVYLSACFELPSSHFELLELVRRDRVALESCSFDDQTLAISGVVRVANLAFHKTVVVRYTVDGWQHQTDVDGEYIPRSNDGTTDRFSFTIILPSRKQFVVGSQLEFAIRFVATDVICTEYWDNNRGENYVVKCCSRNKGVYFDIEDDDDDAVGDDKRDIDNAVEDTATEDNSEVDANN